MSFSLVSGRLLEAFHLGKKSSFRKLPQLDERTSTCFLFTTERAQFSTTYHHHTAYMTGTDSILFDVACVLAFVVLALLLRTLFTEYQKPATITSTRFTANQESQVLDTDTRPRQLSCFLPQRLSPHLAYHHPCRLPLKPCAYRHTRYRRQYFRPGLRDAQQDRDVPLQAQWRRCGVSYR